MRARYAQACRELLGIVRSFALHIARVMEDNLLDAFRSNLGTREESARLGLLLGEISTRWVRRRRTVAGRVDLAAVHAAGRRSVKFGGGISGILLLLITRKRRGRDYAGRCGSQAKSGGCCWTRAELCGRPGSGAGGRAAGAQFRAVEVESVEDFAYVLGWGKRN